MLPAVLGPAGGPLGILCLGAHSDDIEIGCGGTLLRLLAERPGSRSDWVVFSATPEREHGGAGQRGGVPGGRGRDATVVVRDVPRELLPVPWRRDQGLLRGAQARRADPDLVLTPPPRTTCTRTTGTIAELTWNTFRDHLILEYEIPKYEGDLGLPTCSSRSPRPIARSARSSCCCEHFASQRDRHWFRPETFDGLMACAASRCNAPDGFAEGVPRPEDW